VQGKELQVAKKRVGRYPKEFRRMAVERLKNCDNIVALSRELGVHRRLLYKWRDQLDPAEVPEDVSVTDLALVLTSTFVFAKAGSLLILS